ncbi:MAG TPA: PLP-dependent aminotransferase family protein [Gaiellaceae bacterium]|nr:PLP-dependent aminotransferase family protein [Gaiellaceae bacterium]
MVRSIEPVSASSTGPVLALRLDRSLPLREQLEERVRALIRSGVLEPGARLPSTRALAYDLDVSRGVVVSAYAQLAAEGFVRLRPGAVPLVAVTGRAPESVAYEPEFPLVRARYNLRPDLPDLGLFPRADWLRSCRRSLAGTANADLSYGDPFGAIRLRSQLAPFLARTRGVLADADRTGIFSGATHALLVLGAVIRAAGAVRVGVEDPCHRWRARVLAASGLEVVGVPVDEHGVRVDALGDVDAVLVSPDHNFPTGAVLSPDRRSALVDWAAAGDRLVIEDDHDGHFRYGGIQAGALQALAPEHVAYVGSASALLAPAVRLGWAVLPARLVAPVADHLFWTALATSRLTQFALAEMIERGYLDRHLRRSQAAYKRRRAVMLRSLARHFPDAEVGGAAIGLFVPVRIPGETRLLERARERWIALDGLNEHGLTPQPSGLVLGFAASPEPALRRALATLRRLAGDAV